MEKKTITIEGKKAVKILGDLKSLGIIDEYENMRCEIIKLEFETYTPEFKVGDRVVLKREAFKYTKEMVYRLCNEEDSGGCLFFDIIDDTGYQKCLSMEEVNDYFKPYEKPKEGDEYWYIYSRGVNVNRWDNTNYDNSIWNLGLAFHTKEQAEFARERLSKLF